MDFLPCSWAMVLSSTISIANHWYRTHILYPLLDCQGPQKVVPSLWVSYLPTISLVYWPFLYWILVTCSPKASAISVQYCFLEYSPRATCLLWLVFILLDQALVLPCRCVHPSDPNVLEHDCGVAFTLTETNTQLLQILSSLTIINFQDPVSLLPISSGVSMTQDSNQTGGPCSFFIVRHWSHWREVLIWKWVENSVISSGAFGGWFLLSLLQKHPLCVWGASTPSSWN